MNKSRQGIPVHGYGPNSSVTLQSIKEENMNHANDILRVRVVLCALKELDVEGQISAVYYVSGKFLGPVYCSKIMEM